MMNYLISMNRHLRITILLTGFFGSFLLFYMSTNGLFILLAFIFLGVLIKSNVSHARNYSDVMEKSLDKALIKNKIKADISYLSDDYLSGIALNKNDQKITVLRRLNINEEFEIDVYNFSDILESSIQEDGEIVTKTSNNSLISRAIAGGILFGSVGAVIGGLSSQKVTSQHIYKATLSIVFNDIDYPVREIDFLNSKMLVNRKSELYQKVYGELSRWHKTLSVIIKKNEINNNTV
jgi:hypothetical protein